MPRHENNLHGDARRPLLGTSVMVTRAENANDPLAERLRSLGAEVIVQPAIRIEPPADWRPVDEALDRLDDYDWLVFSSANGVRYLLERLRGKISCDTSIPSPPAPLPSDGRGEQEKSPPAIPSDGRGEREKRMLFPRLAAIGPATAEELARFGLRADLVPERYDAESLAETLACHAPGKRFLLARASRGREVLAERLSAAGAAVDQIVVYTSSDVERADDRAVALLRAGKIAWITVTSSAIARSLARLFGDDLRRAKLASISPLTSGVLRELGHEPAVEAVEYTLAGLTAAMVEQSPLALWERGRG